MPPPRLPDLQLILGLFSWLWLSPLPELAINHRLLFSTASFTFFGLVHPVAMSLGGVGLHGARALTKRTRAHHTWRTATGAWLAFTLAAIPWPLWSFGRTLARSLP